MAAAEGVTGCAVGGWQLLKTTGGSQADDGGGWAGGCGTRVFGGSGAESNVRGGSDGTGISAAVVMEGGRGAR